MTTSPSRAETGTLMPAPMAFLLSQLGFHAAQVFAERLMPLGLQPRHFGLLAHLAEGEGRSQQQLADALAIHRNVMVGLVDDMEGRGLVERRRHPSDRRAHAVFLTAPARALLAEARRIAAEYELELLTPLEDSDRTALMALLQRLARHAGLNPDIHPGLQTANHPRGARRVAESRA